MGQHCQTFQGTKDSWMIGVIEGQNGGGIELETGQIRKTKIVDEEEAIAEQGSDPETGTGLMMTIKGGIE